MRSIARWRRATRPASVRWGGRIPRRVAFSPLASRASAGFAAHVIEHTIQCEKTLAALGWHPTEGRRIVRQLTGVLGELEAYGALAAVRVIEAALTDRFVSLGGAVSRAGA